MNDRSPARLDIIHMLPGHLIDHGIEPTRVFVRAGIPWVPDGLLTGPVARAQIFAALDEAGRLLGDPLIGLMLAAKADPLRLGVAGRALFGGLTLRDCLTAHARLMPSVLTGIRLGLSEVGGRAHWTLEMIGSDQDHARILSEGAHAFVVEAMRFITGSPFEFELSFSHRARFAPRLFESHFEAPIRFGIGTGGVLSFDAALLDRPNLCLAGPPHAPLDRPDPPGVAGSSLSDDNLVASVNRVIDGMLMSGEVSVLRAARTLGFASRSFQRHLALCGTSFEQLADDRRRSTAQRLLADGSLGVADIAQALAYSHPAHFIRAFRRWEGLSPLQYRRAITE